MESKITFFRSFYEMAMSLPKKSRLLFLDSLLRYSFEGIEPEFGDDQLARICFIGARPNIDASLSRARKLRETGKAGGRPRKDKTIAKPTENHMVSSDREKPQKKDGETPKPTENHMVSHTPLKKEKEGKYNYISPSDSSSEPCGTAAAKAAPQSRLVCRKCNSPVIGDEQSGWFCEKCNSMMFHPAEKVEGGIACPPEIAASIRRVM